MSDTAKTDLWGQDIALDATGQAKVAASGELLLTDGVATGVQDIALRLFTPLGSLFYDSEFGSLLHEYILEESTPEIRAAFEAEVILRVELDPRVVVGTVTCSVTAWDERSITAEASWRFIDEDSPTNLVMQTNKTTLEMVIADVKPHSESLAAHLSQH